MTDINTENYAIQAILLVAYVLLAAYVCYFYLFREILKLRHGQFHKLMFAVLFACFLLEITAIALNIAVRRQVVHA